VDQPGLFVAVEHFQTQAGARLDEVAKLAPGAINLAGETTLSELAALRAIGPPSGDDGIIELTPLALWALREQLRRDGVEISLLKASSAQMTAAALAIFADGLTDAEVETEFNAWLAARGAGRALWVPAPDRRSARHGCVVITDNLVAEEYWLPAGVYVDHWTLREGLQAPPARELLALPGVTDLADRVR